MKTETQNIKMLFWKDIRETMFKLLPDLTRIIDNIDPGKEFPLYLVKYPYGAMIVENGKCFYPIENKLITIDDPDFPIDLKKQLVYVGTSLPTGIVIKNSFEIFVKIGNRTHTFILYNAGSIFGLWDELDDNPSYHPYKLFHITSGARSIFMIPNIGDTMLHKNLQRDFNLKLPAPKTLIDQWSIFVALSRQLNPQEMWYSELVFFSRKWIDKLKSNDKRWASLYHYFLIYSWRKSAYWRNKLLYDFVFSCIKENRNLKPNPYLADTVKYLLAIGLGEVPGFGIAIDETVAPIHFLQKSYINSYRMKDYIPTLMQPMHFEFKNPVQPVYYSLQFPTTMEFSPKSRKISSTLQDLRELKHLTEVFLVEAKKGKLHLDGTIIDKLIDTIAFDFFHNKTDKHNEIQLTKHLPKKDSALLKCFKNDRQFADNGTFFRGCVRISSKI